MELATFPAGESNRARSLIRRVLQRRRSTCRLTSLVCLDQESIIDELAEREDAFESDEDDKDGQGPTL
jgi:hypothetical protein